MSKHVKHAGPVAGRLPAMGRAWGRVRMTLSRAVWLAALLALPAAAADAVVVRDDAGQTLQLAAPARRIVSLAPHVTENLYAAGAAASVVGAVEYSDYPAAAARLPRVGGYSRVNLEAVLALKPDLVIGWQSGNPPAQIDKLRQLGVRVYLSQPNRLDDVASELERFGQLAGSEATARQAATAFRQRLQTLRSRYSAAPRVNTFYQVWKQPLLTVGGAQIISSVIELCGGHNVFGHLHGMAPSVSAEAVLAANPEIIIASGMGEERPDWLSDWRKFSQLTAVKRDNLFFIPPDRLHRHTPRLLDGAERMCEQLETARKRR